MFLGPGQRARPPWRKNETFWAQSSGNVEISLNPAKTAGMLTIGSGVHITAGDSPIVNTGYHLDTFGIGGNNIARRANGTAAAPTALVSSDLIWQLAPRGYGATAYSGTRGGMRFSAAENWTDTAQGVYFSVLVVSSGATQSVEQLRLFGSGGLAIGSSAILTDPGVGNIQAQLSLKAGAAGLNTGTVVLGSSGGGAVTVSAPTTASSWTLTLPTTTGSSMTVLTTDGTGVATWTDHGYGLASVTAYTSAGTYTWSRGTGTRAVLIMLIGGGGGGGGNGGGFSGAGAGGGGGGGLWKFITNPTSSVTVVVGAGGTAGSSAGATSGSGGTTSFISSATYAANGGVGGGGSTAAILVTGGSGGTASGGDINVTGGSGGGGYSNASLNFPGTGGCSMYGGGGKGFISPGANGAGEVGGFPGGGAGGARANAAQAGAAGADGIAVVWEYK